MAGLCQFGETFVRGPPCRPSFSGRHAEQPFQPWRRRGAGPPKGRIEAKVSSSEAFNTATVEAAQVQARIKILRERFSIEEVDGEGMDGDVASQPVTNKPLKINMDLLLYRSRLARMQSSLTTDKQRQKELLKQAEDGLRRCLTMDATDPRTYVVLGKLLVMQKRYDEARKLYADGTSNTGNQNPYIWAAWGYLESLTGNISRARKLFDAALVVDETHAAAWHKWGILEQKQGNYLRARDLWTRSIQKCRRSPTKQNVYLYCSLAVMAAELGKREEARAWFEEGTRLNEGASSCALWHAWAVMEARIGDPSAVRYLFKRALQANPRSRYTHLAWAIWERRQGNMQQALQLLARGQALNPADPAIYQAWGLLEREAGRYDEARRLFKLGLQADSTHLYLWQAWGCLEFALGRYDEARARFQDGVWADPGNKDVVYVFQAWGVLECRAGNHQLARELFKAALKVDPRSESAWSTWIAMEDDLGRGDAAQDLRIRRSEQQWEFVIPSTFTTRPAGGGANGAGGVTAGLAPPPLGLAPGGVGAGGSAGGLMEAIASTLNRFFKARAESPGGGSLRNRPLRELLPADFRDDLSLEDIISQASAIELPNERAGGASGGEPASPSAAGVAAPAAGAAPVAAGGGSSSNRRVLAAAGANGDAASSSNGRTNGSRPPLFPGGGRPGQGKQRIPTIGLPKLNRPPSSTPRRQPAQQQQQQQQRQQQPPVQRAEQQGQAPPVQQQVEVPASTSNGGGER